MPKSLPPLVFLPGKLCTEKLWEYQIQALKNLCEPLFIDLSRCRTLEEMIAEITMLSPPKFALAGFSMGGYLAMEYMFHEGNRVEKLALIGCSSRGYDEKKRDYYKKILRTMNKFKFRGLSETSIRQLIHSSRHSDVAIIDTIQEMARELGGEVFERQQKAMLNREDRRKDLHKVTCPTLVVGGKEDQLVSEAEFVELAKILPNSKLHVIESCGHMVPLEYPEKLTAFMREWFV